MEMNDVASPDTRTCRSFLYRNRRHRAFVGGFYAAALCFKGNWINNRLGRPILPHREHERTDINAEIAADAVFID